MKTFDYKRAWDEVARPAFEELGLHNGSTALARECIRVAKLTRPFVQDRNLNIPHPDAVDLSPFSDEELSKAALACYALGNWAHGGDLGFWGEGGATWKTANVIDQCLRQRLRVPKDTPACRRPSTGFQIVNGEIRSYLESSRYWVWKKIGFATAENIRKARPYLGCVVKMRAGDTYFDVLDRWEKRVDEVRPEFLPPSDPWRAFFDTGRFDVEE